MFILRRITSKGIECNTCMGEEYVAVFREKNKDEFNERTKQWSQDDMNGIYGIVAFDNGAKLMPLYEKCHYYVMASDGKTFDNISEK